MYTSNMLNSDSYYSSKIYRRRIKYRARELEKVRRFMAGGGFRILSAGFEKIKGK